MSLLIPVLALLLSGPAHADPAVPSARQAGADIQAFRAIGEAGLSTDQRFDAYGSFVAQYPRSPLAEVALARCLELDGDMAGLLASIAPTERAYLVTNFQAHAELLLANPPEGPVLTDAADQPRRRRGNR
jgi:hypothetical protein